MGTISFPPRTRRRTIGIIAFVALLAAATIYARPATAAQDGPRVGQWTKGDRAIVETVAALMERQSKVDASGVVKAPKAKIEREFTWMRRNNPNSPSISSGGTVTGVTRTPSLNVVQTVGTEFTGATGGGSGADSGFVPPDTDGSVGPTQYIVGVNGRIRSFNKTTGTADGALNIDPDTFYASLSSAGISDPLVKYDRLTGRWFITAIDVANNDNVVVIAVSSGSTITSTSSFSFFKFVQSVPLPTGDTSCFFDYPTTGIDATSLIIGGNQFCGALQDFYGSDVYLVKKSSVLGAGPIEVAAFHDLTTGSHGVVTTQTGITTARGLDSWDAGQTESYFIGDDNSLYGLLNFRRITYPGGVPTLSANITITVAQTSLPIPNQHLGNAGGGSALGYIDGNDMRIMPSYIVGGKLYATHGVSVNSAGVANGATAGDRNAVRWYVFNNLTGTPAVEQFGTIYDSTATNPLSYTYGSMRVTGQGHIVYGFTSLGVNQFPGAAYTGRLASDTAGTTSAPALYEAGAGAYNSFDTTFGRPRRWGDYTTMSLDPCDDQTVWAAQEFVAVGGATNGTARWGVRVAQIKAPPPASLSSAVPGSIAQGQFNQNITVTGTSSGGSGFFDTPATNNDACRKRISATVSNGVIVNSVTYNSPTSLTLNVTTFGATTGVATVTVMNPDGQTSSGGILTITTGSPVATPTASSTASNTPTVTATFTPSTTPTATSTPVTAVCSGTLTGSSPVFTRPNTGNPPTTLSSNTSSRYRDLPFTVSVTGTYTMQMTSAVFTGTNADDGYYVLYSPSFTPGTPLTNALQSDDDSGSGLMPLITRSLTAGTQYVLVATTFSNNQTGSFVDQFTGPGTVSFSCTGGPTNTPTVTYTPSATFTPSATLVAGYMLQDGGLELGPSSPYWTQTSTNFGTPICDTSCGGVGPRTGTYWAWFGGAGTAAEAGSLQQVGKIAPGPKSLTFYVWWSSSVSSPPDPTAYFNVRMDGNIIFSLTPATAAAYNTAYTLVTVDISAYADDNTHTLLFEQANVASSASTNVHLDDINIISSGGSTSTPTATPTASNTPVPPRPDTIGVYNGGLFYLRNTNNTGGADINVAFGGDVSDLPVAGDWNGDGVDTIGVYRSSTGFFFLSDSNTSPAVNYTVLFGNPGDTPFAGKWTNDMTISGIGVYRNSNGILYQRKSLTSGFDDFFAIFGNPGDQGFAGDWDANGFDSIGVYRSGNQTWYMTNNSSPSGITFSDYDFVLDITTNLPVAGDWDGDGDSTPGSLTSSGVFSLHPNNSIVGPDNVFAFGPANSKPIAGKWIASSKPPIGAVVPGAGASRYTNENPGGGD